MKTLHIYPHPDLAGRLEYLPGIGEDGADLPADEAKDLIDRGLATTDQPPEPATAPIEAEEQP